MSHGAGDALAGKIRLDAEARGRLLKPCRRLERRGRHRPGARGFRKRALASGPVKASSRLLETQAARPERGGGAAALELDELHFRVEPSDAEFQQVPYEIGAKFCQISKV